MLTKANTFRLAPPTADSAIQALTRVLGEARARSLFAEAVTDVGLHERADTLAVEDIHQVASKLAECEGIVSVLGLALQIRCETYLTLNQVTPS
jgi:hypothetical protein